MLQALIMCPNVHTPVKNIETSFKDSEAANICRCSTKNHEGTNIRSSIFFDFLQPRRCRRSSCLLQSVNTISTDLRGLFLSPPLIDHRPKDKSHPFCLPRSLSSSLCAASSSSLPSPSPPSISPNSLPHFCLSFFVLSPLSPPVLRLPELSAAA